MEEPVPLLALPFADRRVFALVWPNLVAAL
jgi:hypothetical protein